VRLIPPFIVKPVVIGNKNDANDALAIAEASLRPNIRFVTVKSTEQQDIQSLQRISERVIKTRTGDVLSCWLQKLKVRMNGCKADVALTNKLTRIIWSVLTSKQPFDVSKACA